MNDLKNTISNILGAILFIGASIQTYLDSVVAGNPIDWVQVGVAAVLAAIAWFTGKDKNIKAKVQWVS